MNLRSFMPNRISGQIAVIIIASLVVIHAILTATFLLLRPDHRSEPPPDRIATLVELMDATPRDRRTELVADIARAFPDLGLTLAASSAGNAAVSDRRTEFLQHHLGSEYRITAVSRDSSAALQVAVQLRDGEIVTVRMPPMHMPPMLGPAVITLLFIAISLSLLGLWAARGLTRPLRSFARAAENFSPDGAIKPLAEYGPYEIRTAARALNQMRERIKTLIDDRTRMLAAVSHDLRTPITRLRLRCEAIADAALRSSTLDDLSHMNAMVENVLSFLRDGRGSRPATAIDVATLLQTVCDQFADLGRAVTYEGPDHLVVTAHHDDLNRAITNLVDNAVRYGTTCVVRLTNEEDAVTIAIEDDGPGIADAEKAAMVEPFARGDAARGATARAGFGLGLSIASNIIAAHGGTLELRNRQPSGLIAKIGLRRTASAAAA
jgi:signal transduction histidine kinase